MGVNKYAFIVILVFTLALFLSCKTYRLSKQDKEWLPYKVGDTLIFESNHGEVDTVSIDKIESYINPTDPLDVFPTKVQTLFVAGKRTPIMSLNAVMDGAYIEFRLRLGKDKMKYPVMNMWISDIKDSTDIVNFYNFKDCYRITAIQRADNLKDTPIDLRYIYWSKKNGYLGLELNDEYIWILRQFRREGKDILLQ